jgi:nucleoside-diphosphate-sugar epimerase
MSPYHRYINRGRHYGTGHDYRRSRQSRIVGQPVVQLAGDSVTSIIHNPAQASDVEKTGAQALILDIEHASTDELAKAFSGSDAIIWSAGAGGGDTARTYAVDRDAAKRCIDAATLAGVKRYITVSYYYADHPEVFGPEDSMYAYAQAKAAADTYLRESELEWTILGPTALTLQTPSGRITVDTARKTAAIPPTSRGNVAAVLVAAVHSPGTIGKTVNFHDGDTDINRALQTPPPKDDSEVR